MQLLSLDSLAFLNKNYFMHRHVLKSKLHRGMVTKADVEYEGSIEIPTDLMDLAGLWEGEKVLVASATSGNRLETYVQPGKPGTGEIIVNGGAALLIASATSTN